ncbi:unnamed protein product [Caenorhabditis bovis]|uniref:RRM domain-containing protein n=1 Tax=Caenorhabditis bovis TaxID=2654633 RepID=A0A8S1EQD6_9PELO|nr:unnamed protein product [Caenorhabditis bovis]
MNQPFKNQFINDRDRSQRSVFVGNISYDVPEDIIRSIFTKVGPVVSMKMVHDRETGKPKGYGFIEYADVNTAEMAIRNLNGYELSGRPLRVDSAAHGANTIDEISAPQAVVAPQEENPYGSEVEPGKAPEAISKCVASLAPEKMFELMKQMKDAVHANPNEVKAMLTSNPQLAYALLQAQVVMRIVDPQVAMAMLHRETSTNITPFHHMQTSAGPSPSPFAMPTTSAPMKPPTVAPVAVGGGYAGGYAPVTQMPPPFAQPPPPMVAQTPMQQQQQQSDITPEEQQNAQLLMQVMQLSEEELELLPRGDREKIIELRQQLKRNVK